MVRPRFRVAPRSKDGYDCLRQVDAKGGSRANTEVVSFAPSWQHARAKEWKAQAYRQIIWFALSRKPMATLLKLRIGVSDDPTAFQPSLNDCLDAMLQQS